MDDFGGDSTHPMDAKGRVSLPARFRKTLPDDLVLIRSPDRRFPSLWIYEPHAYRLWVESIFESKGGFQANSVSQNALKRRLLGRKTDIKVDSAGRIHVPQDLRRYASLESSAVFLGVGEHIEIWNADILAQSDEFYDDVEVFDLP
jgi:MraZ protein